MVLTILSELIADAAIKNEIPANVTELYDMFTDLCLLRWDAQKGIQSTFEFQVKRLALSDLAYEWQTLGLTGEPEHVALGRVRKRFDDAGLPCDADLLMQEVRERSGLLRLTEASTLEFDHLSFQAFFASGILRDRSDFDAFAAEHFFDPWWELPIFFSVGRKAKADELLEALDARLTREPLSAAEMTVAGKQLGLILQAGLATSGVVKTKWVVRGIKLLSDALTRLVSGDSIPEVQHEHLPLIIYYVLFYQWAEGSYGSKVLESSLLEILTDPRRKFSDQEYWLLSAPALDLGLDSDEAFSARLLGIDDRRITALAGITLGSNDQSPALKKLVAKLRKRLRGAITPIRELFEWPGSARKR